MVALPLISGIVLGGQILITTDDLYLLLLSAAAGTCIMARRVHFLPLLARVLRMRIATGHGYSALKYPLLVVVLMAHATSLRHATTITHATTACDVATTGLAATLMLLMVAVLHALGSLEMLPSHTVPSHIVLRTARLIQLIVVAAAGHGRALVLLWVARGVSVVLLTLVLAATLNGNSRL